MKQIVHADTMRFWGDSHLACKQKDLDDNEGWVSNHWDGPLDRRVNCKTCIRIVKQRIRNRKRKTKKGGRRGDR